MSQKKMAASAHFHVLDNVAPWEFHEALRQYGFRNHSKLVFHIFYNLPCYTFFSPSYF
jgi:hypothetical protein